MAVFTFILENQKFQCEYYSGLNILGHAQTLELKTGSQCGGHGVCGKDIFQINPEHQRLYLSAPTEIEKTHLGALKIQEGCRLGCQTFFNEEPKNIEINIIL